LREVELAVREGELVTGELVPGELVTGELGPLELPGELATGGLGNVPLRRASCISCIRFSLTLILFTSPSTSLPPLFVRLLVLERLIENKHYIQT
jgi:hypothetical protein